MNKPFVLVLAAGLLGGFHVARAEGPLASNIEPVRILETESLTDDDGETPTDISGIACMPKSGTERVCLIINDEDRFGQFVTLAEDRLVGNQKIRLIGKQPSDSTIGKEPGAAACSAGKAKFKDLDGEAVAFAAPYFYVAGSHGCSRHGDKLRTSAFIVARVQVDDQGKPTNEQAETTYRLADALRTAPEIGSFFGEDLNEDNGLNVEGAAVIDGRLIVGLRAPVLQGRAFLVSVSLDHLFSRASAPPPSDVRVIPVPLGRNAGIRDLATLPDGRLLILAGAAQEQKRVPYSLFVADLASAGVVRHLATIKDVFEDGTQGKAEGVVVLESTAETARVLVVFDSLRNGGPREYSIPLR